VLAQPDKRILILRRFESSGVLTLADKFERLLADCSLALSHSSYKDGVIAVRVFVESLKLTRNTDKRLARSAIYCGKTLLELEHCVGEPRISAVVSCEHTQFHKQVQSKNIPELAEFFKHSTFVYILQLAKTVSPLLTESQLVFDEAVRRADGE
jgi:hypothetical protein